MHCVAMLIFVCGLSYSATTFAQLTTREAKIRTGYIHNFTKYASWPSQAFDRPDSPFIIGVYGFTDLDEYLQLIAQHRKVGNRSIQFKRFQDLDSCGNCHLLYVQSELTDDQARRLAAALDGTHVLAVGESPHFLKQGGTIRFVVRNNLLNLDLSMAAANARKHSFRSQLLRLDVVHRVK